MVRMNGRELFALAVVLLLSVVIVAHRMHHDATIWDPDSAIYLRMTLQDRGVTPPEALRSTNQLMQTLRHTDILGKRNFTDRIRRHFTAGNSNYSKAARSIRRWARSFIRVSERSA